MLTILIIERNAKFQLEVREYKVAILFVPPKFTDSLRFHEKIAWVTVPVTD